MLILVILDRIPGCSVRVSEIGEILGVDEDQLGEFCYDFTHLEVSPQSRQDLISNYRRIANIPTY